MKGKQGIQNVHSRTTVKHFICKHENARKGNRDGTDGNQQNNFSSHLDLSDHRSELD
jgi:hypothetical protein